MPNANAQSEGAKSEKKYKMSSDKELKKMCAYSGVIGLVGYVVASRSKNVEVLQFVCGFLAVTLCQLATKVDKKMKG
jgi:hypothetical protein